MPFAKFGQFTIKDFQRVERQTQKAQQGEKSARPKIPQRTKKPCVQRKADRRAQRRSKEHIQSQLAAADPQREREKKRRKRKTVERVKHGGEQMRPPPPKPDRAQQIVHKRGGSAEK